VNDGELKCKKEYSDGTLEHLNNMVRGIIHFTKEEQEVDILPALDLKQKVDKKTKQVERMVHCKKTHTNINVKERSNHPRSKKKAIIKGFSGRARALSAQKSLG
jgi:hypothetical protein